MVFFDLNKTSCKLFRRQRIRDNNIYKNKQKNTIVIVNKYIMMKTAFEF